MDKYRLLNYATYLCLNILMYVDDSYGRLDDVKNIFKNRKNHDSPLLEDFEDKNHLIFTDDTIDEFDKVFIANNCIEDYLRYCIFSFSTDYHISKLTVSKILNDIAVCLQLRKNEKILNSDITFDLKLQFLDDKEIENCIMAYNKLLEINESNQTKYDELIDRILDVI